MPGEVILLVEDDVVSAKFCRRVLETHGYVVYHAKDCQSARGLMMEQSFALIFVDLMLPDGDGFELTRYVRGRPELAGIPVIMCSACEREETFSEAFAAGVNDFIRKPSRRTELLVRAANVLQLREAQLRVVALQQSKTMMSMASLVAHEINNPLSAAYYFLQVLKGSTPEDAESKRTFKMLTEVLDRIRNLVVDMRTVALVDESVETEVPLSETLRLACRILSVRNSKGTWVRCDVLQDFHVRAHPGLQAQALVAVGGYWLDLLDSLGGGGLEFVVTGDPHERQVVLHLKPSQPPGLLPLAELPVETPEVVLARRHLMQAGACLRSGLAHDLLPNLTIFWPSADIQSVILREETHLS
jgi:DNA-binding response OmpR family regulator